MSTTSAYADAVQDAATRLAGLIPRNHDDAHKSRRLKGIHEQLVQMVEVEEREAERLPVERFYADYDNVDNLMRKIVENGLPGFTYFDIDGHSGGLSVARSKDSPVVAYATPWWEGESSLGMAVMDEDGDYVPHGDALIPMPWTGEIDADARLWAAVVLPRLEKLLPADPQKNPQK